MAKMKSSVIVAGMPRAGSTWIYYNFVKHPGAAMPSVKETFFFGSNFERGFDWYYSLYDDNIGSRVAFDISPNYYCDDTFFTKVSEFDVDHKCVLVLREPAEWLVSLYSQIKSFTPNMPPLDEFLNEVTINFDGGSYVIRPAEFPFEGMVERFAEHYRGRLLLINFAEISSNPLAVLNSIEEFAGLQPYFTEETAHVSPVNVSIPEFNLVAYLSTKRALRNLAARFLPQAVRARLLDYLYKVGERSNKDMTEVARLESRFEPVYGQKYFREANIIHL